MPLPEKIRVLIMAHACCSVSCFALLSSSKTVGYKDSSWINRCPRQDWGFLRYRLGTARKLKATKCWLGDDDPPAKSPTSEFTIQGNAGSATQGEVEFQAISVLGRSKGSSYELSGILISLQAEVPTKESDL